MDWLESLNVLLSPFFVGLLVAAGVGLIIGLEREFNTHDEPSHIGGIRTFTLVAVLGHVVGFLAQHIHSSVIIAAIIGFFALVTVAYFVQTQKGKMGLTTEIALLLTFTLGVVISGGYFRESLAVVVLMALILSLKEQLHSIIRQITEEELFAFIKFIVMALLILPMLPDQPFGPENLLNLRDMGWIVVLVLSISFAGYLLLKFGSAKKGIFLTALIGGLISSTLIAWVFSGRSRERKDLSAAFGAGIVLASSIMFVRVFVLTTLFAFPVAVKLLPALLIMLLASLFPAWRFTRQNKFDSDAPQLSPGNPLDIKNAVLFVLLYTGVTFLMYSSRQWLGTTMTYLSGAVAGIADMDAITISTAKWSATAPDTTRQAAIIILLAMMSNSAFKLSVSVLNGSPELRRPVITGFGLILLVGGVFTTFWLLKTN
ncbi:MAG: MgtC/SapB family protein [Saprospiraceae bacterium]